MCAYIYTYLISLSTAKTLIQSRCTSSHEWILQIRNIYHGILFSYKEKRCFQKNGYDLKSLCEISLRKKNAAYFSLIYIYIYIFSHIYIIHIIFKWCFIWEKMSSCCLQRHRLLSIFGLPPLLWDGFSFEIASPSPITSACDKALVLKGERTGNIHLSRLLV